MNSTALTQFLRFPKQNTCSKNKRGILKVVKMSPPLDDARKIKQPEPIIQEHLEARQVGFSISCISQKSDVPCE